MQFRARLLLSLWWTLEFHTKQGILRSHSERNENYYSFSSTCLQCRDIPSAWSGPPPTHPTIDCCPLYSCSFCLWFCIVIGVEVGKCAIQVACGSRRPAEIPSSSVFVLSLTRAELLDRCSIECIKFLNLVLCYLWHILFSHILFFLFTWLDFRRLK